MQESPWCRSERLAAELGCAYTYAGVTGVYSQKIFTKLEHTTLKSLNYADFRDEKGELYLKDTREHDKIIICFKKLRLRHISFLYLYCLIKFEVSVSKETFSNKLFSRIKRLA